MSTVFAVKLVSFVIRLSMFRPSVNTAQERKPVQVRGAIGEKRKNQPEKIARGVRHGKARERFSHQAPPLLFLSSLVLTRL